MSNTIGQISLNISVFLYWVLYLPQLFHNRNKNSLKEMSLTMQGLLYTCYLTDLVYGFGQDMPWQYKSVTIVGLFLLSIQQFQLFRHWIVLEKIKRRIITGVSFLLLLLLASSISSIFFGIGEEWSIAAGFASRFLALLYAIPQILKNALLHSGKALSKITLSINIFLALLDSISAWTLDWDWPSKLGGFVAFIVSLILLAQTRTKSRIVALGYISRSGRLRPEVSTHKWVNAPFEKGGSSRSEVGDFYE